MQQLNPERGLEYQSISYKMNIPREKLAEAQAKAETITGKYLPAEDWSSLSLLDKEASNDKLMTTIELLVGGFALFLGLVGVTGTFSAVAGSFSARRREFAVLRSVGLSPKGMNKVCGVCFTGLWKLTLYVEAERKPSYLHIVKICPFKISQMSMETEGREG